ncbi:MAG: PVC-type heme-binding CxxCH protein [Planctomycetota bacterium]
MRLIRLLPLVPAFITVGTMVSQVSGQGFSPDDALKRMSVAKGFHVELVASEPMIRQPVAMNFDDRGRLWVIQYLQYPNPVGLKAVKVDRYLRTVYDRVPEPPPKGPVGADLVTILEDSNGDGKADQSKNFVTGLNLASGLAIGHGGVFVVQPPYLLFYADRDRDDKPDGDPEVLLTGFGMEDSHAFANSLQWGPDGWLYGAQGSTVTAKIRGITFQQGIWRFHPVTKEFELFAEGGGNTWGLDFDAHGNAIAGTNFGHSAMLHQMQGAYYVKGFAKHGELQNPHAYGYFEHVPYFLFKGGHVTCGGVIYQGGSFPQKMNQQYVAANLLSNAIYWHVLERDRSTFKARFGGDLLLANDTWFRPVDCAVGPDGSVYIADWYDERANHVDPKDDWNKTNGRIYRIQADSAPKVAPPDLSKKTSRELVDLVNHPNEWFARTARRLLAERAEAAVATELEPVAISDADPARAVQALWALNGVGGRTEKLTVRLFSSPHEDVRTWSVRLACDAKDVPPIVHEALVKQAVKETSPVVRAQLAASAKRLPGPKALPLIAALLEHGEDVDDPCIPLLLWWSLEDKAVSDRALVLRLWQDPGFWKLPLVKKHLVERLARRYSAGGTDEDYASCAALLSLVPNSDSAALVVAGMEKGMAGRRLPQVPSPLEEPLANLWKENKPTIPLIRLAVRLGSVPAYRQCLAIVADHRRSPSDRTALLELLGQVGDAECIEPLLAILRDHQANGIKLAALSALERFNDPRVPQNLLDLYPTFPGDLRDRARNVLASRKPWAAMLLETVDAGKIDPKEVSVEQLRRIKLFEDASLTSIIEKHWGKIQEQTPGEIAARVHGINVSLGLAPGDAGKGKPLFQKNCGTCHSLFGEGNKIGPDLTGADRMNRVFLLSNIVDPSSVIRKEYMNFNVLMSDGRLLTGLMPESTADTVTILDAKNERTVVSRMDIEEIQPSAKSLMPDKILDGLTAAEVRDLMAYLQSDPDKK